MAIDEIDLDMSHSRQRALRRKRVIASCVERREKDLRTHPILQRRRLEQQQNEEQERKTKISRGKKHPTSRTDHEEEGVGFRPSSPKICQNSSVQSSPLSPNLLEENTPCSTKKKSPGAGKTVTRYSKLTSESIDPLTFNRSSTTSSSSPGSKGDEGFKPHASLKKTTPSSPSILRYGKFSRLPTKPSPTKVAFEDTTNDEKLYDNEIEYGRDCTNNAPPSAARRSCISNYKSTLASPIETNSYSHLLQNSVAQLSKKTSEREAPLTPSKTSYFATYGANATSTTDVNSLSQSSQRSTTSNNVKKKPWQAALNYDDDGDDDDDFTFEEMTRFSRMKKKKAIKTPMKGTDVGSETSPRTHTKSTIAKKTMAVESTVQQESSADAAINVESNGLTVPRTATSNKKIMKHCYKTTVSKKNRFDIEGTSSDEDIEDYYRKRPFRCDSNGNGQSSSQSSLPKNLACQRATADKNEFEHAPMRNNIDCSRQEQTQSTAQKLNPQNRIANSLTTKYLNRNSSSDSDNSEKDYLASKQAVLAKIQAKRDAKYKNNPLAFEKRDNEEWKEKIVNGSALGNSYSAGNTRAGSTTLKGRIGTEILIKQHSDDNTGNHNLYKNRGDATRLSQSRQRSFIKRRHKIEDPNLADETISSLGSPPDEIPLPSKNPCEKSSNLNSTSCKTSMDDVDDLWDDSDHCGGNHNGSDSDTADGNGKHRIEKRRKVSSVKEKCQPHSRKARSNEHPRDNLQHNARKSVTISEPIYSRPSLPNYMHSNPPDNRGRTSKMLLSKDEDEDLSLSDDDQMLQELKPDFKDPKLGPPSDLVPLFLPNKYKPSMSSLKSLEISDDEIEDSDGEAIDMGGEEEMGKVPASINRYLQDYQREGIRFMYASVINKKGCVLGDDMGLGKTVQLISLIAALLKRTGTGIDALENKRRQRRLIRMIDEREKNEDQALITGMYSGFQRSPILDDIDFPEHVPILIIVPASVIKNWQNEFEDWGYFDVGVYCGQSRENAIERIKAGLDFILITGKSLFTRDLDFCNFVCIQWKLVVVDEFHEYKNPDSKAHKCLMNIRDNSRCPIIGMTGTLMQNNHDELFHLMDLARPSLLGDKQSFTEYIARPIKYARAKDASEETKMLAKRRELELVRTLSKAYLSRKKTDVLKDSLKQKNEKVIFCELSEVQKKIYRHVVTLPDFHILKTMNGACDCGVNQQYFKGFLKMKSRKEQIDYQRRHKSQLVSMKNCCYKYPYNPNKENPDDPEINPDAVLWKQKHEKIVEDPSLIDGHIFDGKYVACEQCPSCILFAAMHKLVKIASHPSLLQVDRLESGRFAEKKLEFAKVALSPDVLPELPGQSYYKADSIMNDHHKLSGKMRALDHLLEKYQRKNHRVLVFSHSVQMLDLIQQHVKTRGYSNLRLDGTVPTSSRQPLVDKFQNDDSIFMFLISTKAGGLGLNLTAANKVIIFDVNWNPSYDEQAQDRSFRIGQKKNVEVVRLVSRGTIEELVYCRQVYKVQLKKQTFGSLMNDENQPQIFRGVSQDQNRKGELFGVENLLSFKDGSFMDKIWKTSGNTKEVFDASKLGEDLAKISPEKLEMGAQGEDGIQGEKNHSSLKQLFQRSNDDEDNSEVSDLGFNHEDYFRQDRGRARVMEGEDGYEEEMGGESQVIQVTTKLACQNMGVFPTDDCCDHSETPVQTREEPALASIQEENSPRCDGTSDVGESVVPSPMTNSNALSSTHPTNDNRIPLNVLVNNLTSGSIDAKNRNLLQTEILHENRDKNIVNSQTPSRDPIDIDSSSNANTPKQPTVAENTTALNRMHKHQSTNLVPKLNQNNPAKFSLMGIVFENSGKKYENTLLKQHGLYIPSYAKKRTK